MTLMYHRGPSQLTHVKELDCTAVSSGRCGFVNLCGKEIRKYFMKLKGNLASGVSHD